MKVSLHKSVLLRTVLLAGVASAVLPCTTAFAQIETVMVTAQKRAQNLQDVPVAVTAISSQSLQRGDLSGIQELQQVAPSLTFSDSLNSRGQGLNLRGIGTQNFSDGVEPSVSTVVDGVVMGRQAMSVFDLADIKRVEVLKGPQGTLFGINSSAGVLNIVTQKPSADAEYFGSATYASHNEVKLKGYANGELADNLDGRISGYYNRHDGTVRNVFNGQKVNNNNQWALRGRLLYTPTERLQLLLTADYEGIDNRCCVFTARSATPAFAAAISPVVAGTNNHTSNDDSPTFGRQWGWGVSLEADYDLGWGSLISISAYRGFHDYDNNDADAVPAPLFKINNGLQTQHQVSEELRLQSNSGARLEYTAGVFVLSQTLDTQTRQKGTIFGINMGSDVARSMDRLNYALFGQATYHVTDWFRLIGGLRWTHDDLSAWFERANAPGVVTGFFFSPPLSRVTIKGSDNYLSYKAGAQVDLAKDVMAYATVTTGFKGKALNLLNNLSAASVASGDAVLNPETSTDYEVGLRSEWWNRRVVANVTGFWAVYKNFQAQTYDANTNTFGLANAGKMRTRGVEGAITVQPVPGLTLSANGAYTEATFLNYIGQCYGGQTVAEGCVGGHQNLSGATLANSPKFKYTLTADYDFPLPSLDKVGYVHASYYHTSDLQFSVTQDPGTIQKAYGIMDLAFGLETEDGRYSLAVFAKNLFNQHYASTIAGAVLQTGSYVQLLPFDSSRIVGVRLSGHF